MENVLKADHAALENSGKQEPLRDTARPAQLEKGQTENTCHDQVQR
jgi:hypothetical protein